MQHPSLEVKGAKEHEVHDPKEGDKNPPCCLERIQAFALVPLFNVQVQIQSPIFNLKAHSPLVYPKHILHSFDAMSSRAWSEESSSSSDP